MTERDETALKSLEQKMLVVRDYVEAVGRHYKTGFFLYGPGGVGKSFAVLQFLEQLDVAYKLFNSRMTAKGLFTTLQDAPDAIHVLEDMERLHADGYAQGILRSALWAQQGRDRKVTWTTATDGPEEFTFRGGLILISNRPLPNIAEAKAMATRIEVHKLDVSEAELTAKMRELAKAGYSECDKQVLSPDSCVEVTEYLLKECKAAGCALDLRLQRKAFQTFRQHAADHSANHWTDLVAASVRETSCHFRHQADTATPEIRKARRRNAVREVVAVTADAKEQERMYREKTGASRADFFRRKGEVEGGEFDAADAA